MPNMTFILPEDDMSLYLQSSIIMDFLVVLDNLEVISINFAFHNSLGDLDVNIK